MNRRSTPSAPSPDPEPPLNRLLRHVAMTLRACLAELGALGLEPQKMSALDLDDEDYVRSLPAGDRLAHLLLLLSTMPPRLSQLGLAQTVLDRLAHAMIASALRRLVPGSLVVGEEASERDWDAVRRAPAGTLVWILDAVDGSGLEDTVGFGYSSNVLLYRKGIALEGAPLMSVTVTSSGRMLGWIAPGRVGAAHLDHPDHYTGEPTFIEPLEPLVPMDVVRHDWIAVVAAQPKHRALVAPLLESTQRWTVMTLGGAPALPGLVLGRLAAVVIPSPQTRHDAAPLLPLASGMGLHFIDIRAVTSYTDAEVRAFFAGVHPPGSPYYKPIPAMVVARDLAAGLELASILCDQLEYLRELEDREEGFSGAP